MMTHWINEGMNLLAGNSRYVHYGRSDQLGFVGLFILFLTTPILLLIFI